MRVRCAHAWREYIRQSPEVVGTHTMACVHVYVRASTNQRPGEAVPVSVMVTVRYCNGRGQDCPLSCSVTVALSSFDLLLPSPGGDPPESPSGGVSSPLSVSPGSVLRVGQSAIRWSSPLQK